MSAQSPERKAQRDTNCNVPYLRVTSAMPAASDTSPSSSSDAPQPPPRRWRRRKKILVGLFALAVFTGGLLAVAAWHLWHQRTSYAERALQHLLPQFKPGLAQLDITSNEIRVTDLAFQEVAAEKPFATLRSFSVVGWQDTLRHRSVVGKITLDGLHLSATAAELPRLLTALLPPTSVPTPTAPAGTPPQLPRLSLEGVDLTDFKFHLEGDAHTPHIEFTLDHTLENLRLSPTEAPSLKSATLHLRDLIIRTPDGSSLQLPKLTLEVSYDAETGLVHLHHLDLPAAVELKLLPALGDFIARFPPSSEPDSPLPLWFKGLVIERVTVPQFTVSAPDGLPTHPALPAIAVEVTTALDSRDVTWKPGQPLTRPGRHETTLSNVAIRPLASKSGHLLVPSLSLTAYQDGGIWHLAKSHAPGADIHWTPELEAALLPASTRNPATSGQSPPALHLNAVTLKDVRLRLDPTPRLPLQIDCRLDLDSRDLRFENGSLTSAEPQKFSLRQIVTQIPGSRTAAPTTIDSIEAILRPDTLFATGLIDRIHIARPHLSYHVDLHAYAAEKKAAGKKPPPPSRATPLELPPLLEKLHFAHLAITEGRVKVFGIWGAEFEAETTFHLTTEPLDSLSQPASRHTLVIDETRLNATGDKPLPVARVGRLEVKADLPQLLTQRRLESLILTGGQVEFGEAFTSILDTGRAASSDAPAPPPPAPPVTLGKPNWSAGKVAINDFNITLQKIAPGLPPVTFTVQFEALNTPLQPEGLLENFDEQRIELTNLNIKAPYGQPRPVAQLDTIFIHFTLDSLLRQRITKVEILNPTLYVGEPLFWYVDYYRKYAAGEIKSDADRFALAAVNHDLALAVAADSVAAPTTRLAWAVEELQVHAGKLILAPKGVPLPGFRQPFPFSFNTKLGSGEFDAVFDIPPDNYPFEKLKLELRGMRGQVRFNMPMKDVNNNLTETFWVDQIRWKQLHIEKAHLSVTYDMNGIYGKFGGEAYEGYLEGGFDVFLNDSYTWDGWISGTNVRSTEITEKMTPAYLLLDGKVNGSLIAAGDAKELYQADITVSNATPGKFSIAALNDILDKLPPKASDSLTNQITHIGVETLRDFDYDTVEAKARFHGREGTGHLKIAGPYGSRNFEINVFDHRWKVDPSDSIITVPIAAP